MGQQAVIRELFIRYAAGKSSVEERAALLAYLQGDPFPEAIPPVEELYVNDRIAPITVAESEAIFQFIVQQPVAAREIPMRPYRWWLRIAAVLLPLVAVSVLLYHYLRAPAMIRYSNTGTEVRVISLADGTRIHLNRHSAIRLAKNYLQQVRCEVWLEGEAFFDIARDANRRFTVHADVLEVSNLGTAFNINTNGGNPVVILNSGAVKVAAMQVSTVRILRPGEAAYFDAGSRALRVQRTDTLYHTAWKYNLLPFRAARLEEVLETIRQHYHIDTIIFKEEGIRGQQFTGYLTSNNLKQALVTLEQVFNLKITQENNQIVVNNKKS
ncbi:FecR domain-containing protein [Chitinophaga pendula]|uniref:FecR family protein n=1 Tax=Chitinophaga TaxID=79328 RepID=UPI000BAF27C8|nr:MULTISPECIES: FecR domain-containing protein [Chitinophaga]ASZ11671.1 hypothetical protein CK934_12220 [Chitinophaga sp. MD30]UCJ05316.1 FecR domain-containing protein [Chitinophaga pendula]